MRAGLVLGLAACQFRHGGLLADGRPIDDAADVAADAIKSHLVAWYEMETLSTGLAPDSSGNGHAGRCTACPSVQPGHVGMAYLFATGQRIDVASQGELSSMTSLTAALWMRLDAQITYYVCPLNKGLGPAADDTWQFCLDPNRKPQFNTSDGITADRMTASDVFPIGAWHHIAIVWDGTTKQLWYDGQLSISDTGKMLAFDQRDITIGADVDDITTHANWVELPGALDDLRIYDHALQPTEIVALAGM